MPGIRVQNLASTLKPKCDDQLRQCRTRTYLPVDVGQPGLIHLPGPEAGGAHGGLHHGGVVGAPGVCLATGQTITEEGEHPAQEGPQVQVVMGVLVPSHQHGDGVPVGVVQEGLPGGGEPLLQNPGGARPRAVDLLQCD